MSCALLSDLAWLPRPPADFREQCRAVLAHAAEHHDGEQDGGEPDGGGALGRRLRFLAGHALNINQLTRLDQILRRARAEGADLAPLVPLRLGLISNATTSLIGPALTASAARHGIALDLIETDYDQAVQEALQPESHLNRAKPELVLVSINHVGLPLRSAPGDGAAADQAVAASLDLLAMIRDGIRRGCGAPVIFETVARPPEPLFGSYDLRVPGAPRRLVDAFNRALAESLRDSPHLLLDVAGLAETVGLAEWHDPVQWYLAKLPFAQKMVPLYADHVARLLAAVRGKTRRCLVLDLDNTLWSGVIGDDGLTGIVLGQGSPVGEAFLGVQRMALALRERGIVLAVSSKNNDATARLPFREHPEMLLRENHIAVFQANWTDKATNLKAIARTLALGLESLVLLDDNPAEREQVRQAVPEVAVPELPADAALYPRVLLAAGYFEAIAFSGEDSRRADDYQANAERAALLETAGDLDAYLRSLDMVISFSPFDAVGRDRITQLINKSNQFNLTTRRYTAAEVQEIEADPSCFALQVRLADRFADNGMISVVICRRQGETWEIDTWLMSCRVLGRKVEVAVLQEIARQARAAGAKRLLGRYIPTSRNELVKDHYPKLGFSLLTQQEDGSSNWGLDLAALGPADLPMEIRRAGFAAAPGSP